MSDPENTLQEAFGRFRSESLVQARGAADLGAVRRVARRRTVTRRTALAVTAVALVAVPFALRGLQSRQVDPPVTPPSPPASQSVVPPSPAPPSATAQPPVTRAAVGSATLTVPAWGSGAIRYCPTGQVDMTRKRSLSETDPRVEIVSFARADVDHDGDLEGVVNLFCGYQGGDNQVIVVGRDDTGRLTTLGQVAATGEKLPVKTILDVRAEPNGDVGVQVADRGVCCGTDRRTVEKQWRVYRWDGQRFTHVSGSREFHPSAPRTDVALTLSPLTLGAPAGGVRRGTATVTVTNQGPANAPGMLVDFGIYAYHGIASQVQITARGTTCTTEPARGENDRLAGLLATCHIPALAVGASRTYTFDVVSPVANDAGIAAAPGITVQAFASAEQPGIRMLDDTDGSDNTVSLQVSLG